MAPHRRKGGPRRHGASARLHGTVLCAAMLCGVLSGLPARANQAEPVGGLTADEMAALQDSVRRCWLVDPSVVGAPDMTVTVRVRLNRDGTVVRGSATVLDDPAMRDTPEWQTAAQSARRAVEHPACQPFALPADRWPDWQVIEFTFDPREMF